MSSILRIFTPGNLDIDPNLDQVRPIAKMSLNYEPPPGQTVEIVNILGGVINGVDVIKHLDSVISPEPTNPTMITLGKQLWRGDYRIGIAQRVRHTYPGGVASFSAGATYNAGASWSLPLPLSARVYRPHGIGFPTAFDFLRNGMDPIWSRHEDVNVIGQVVGTMRQAGEAETINMVNTRNTSFVQLVEPVDRFDGPVVILNGAVSDPVPYIDIESLYDLSSNSRGYLWGVDYVINTSGRVIFLCGDSPGRISGAAVASDVGTPDTPDAGSFERAVSFLLGSIPVAVFASDATAKITGFDWFVTPALTPDSSGVYPPGGDTVAVGKIIAYVPKTGESFVVYDSSVNSDVFNGTITFQAPINFSAGDVLRLYRVTQVGATENVEVTLWLNRRVVLVGPHAHVTSGRLNYFWNQAVGEGRSLTLRDKLIVMAGMKARTEKSTASFAAFVEALLGCPLSPFDGAFVTELRQPESMGYVPGQIGIYGAIQEFDISLDLAVKLGDPVSLLQSLTTAVDGVTITDIYSDPNFMQFSPDGAPPSDDPSALAYVRSKVVGPIELPSDFVAQYPTGTPVFLAALVLQAKSFRIDLGVYASRLFFKDPGMQQRIFDAIDVVKPSGTDYWLRLSDGTPVVKTAPLQLSVNVSSNLDLPTDNANRIFNDADFATGQFFNFYIFTLPGSTPKIGDQYMLTLFDTGTKSSVQTLSLNDFNGHPLFPMEAIYERWATDINAMVPASTFVVADVFNHQLRIQVKPAFGNLEQVRYTTPYTAFAKQINGNGTVLFSHSLADLIAPDDISRVFRILDEAIGTMNGYRELKISAGGAGPTDYLLLADYGAGSYDATAAVLPAASTTVYGAAVIPALNPADVPPPRIGKLRLEGFAYSNNGRIDGSIAIGYTLVGGFVSPNNLILTISHSDPAVLAAPIVLTRTMQATDTSFDSVFAGMAEEVMTDPTLAQYFTADYPVTGSPADQKLIILPVNPDDPVLTGFTFVLSASAGAPTLYMANSVAFVTGGTVTRLITPSAPPSMTVFFSWAGFPVRTATTSVYSQRTSGAGNSFGFDVIAETIPAPVTSPVSVSITIGPGSYGTPRSVSIQNMQIVTNNYPEYSRDDNFPVLWDAFRIQPFPTTFTDGLPLVPAGSNPPIVVPNPVPDLYYRKNEVHVDATPRLISPSQTLILQSADDYAYIPVYMGPVAGTLRDVLQRKPVATDVNTTYLVGSSVLYVDNGDGTFTDLILGTDYTEFGPAFLQIDFALSPPLRTARVIGYVKSPDYFYYFEGPRAPAKIVIRRRSSAAGVRALYNEPTGGPNDFREANKSNGSGAPIAAPYGIPQYLASSVKDKPAFGLDTEVIKIIDAGFTIRRVR